MFKIHLQNNVREQQWEGSTEAGTDKLLKPLSKTPGNL